MVITISTKDKYRSFGNDEEPYRNNLELWENEKLIKSKQYVCRPNVDKDLWGTKCFIIVDMLSTSKIISFTLS